jgi:NAD+ synthase (glutamine-hydrolysing)
VKIQICQVNSTVGDFEANQQKISAALADSMADLFVFPECAICGYPPQDLLDYPEFAEKSESVLQSLAASHPTKSFLVGGVERNQQKGRPLRNVAYFVSGGRVVERYFKRLLPSYDVFDEDRFFEPGRESKIITLNGKKIFITVCEDIWNDEVQTHLHNRYDQQPLSEVKGCDLHINLSASPYELKKVSAKAKMLAGLAQRHSVPLLYVNSVGANDSLIFDGRSCFISASGQITDLLPAFQEANVVIDSERPGSAAVMPSGDIADLYDALVLGIRDYCQKQGFHSVILGMSGGIDSALIACLAADALGAQNVVGVLMPSRFTSQASNEDAIQMARKLQNPIHFLPIEAIFSASLHTLEKAFEGTQPGVAEENLQSRARGMILMGLSNKFNCLLLTTGNKSELATGYCTLYGDMNGGLAPIADVYKTQVYELAREANRRSDRIPERVFTKAPSAELRLNQTDQDTLPPYDRLDSMLELILEQFKTGDDLVARGFEESEVNQVLRWIERNEYKRYQMPLGLKVSKKAFGIGRRLPLVHRFFSSSALATDSSPIVRK